MPGVQDPTVVDVVANHDGHPLLIMCETRRWDASPDRIVELQDKIDLYLKFATEGQLERMHPELHGPVMFELHCGESPDPLTQEFIETVREELKEEFQIDFVVTVIEGYCE